MDLAGLGENRIKSRRIPTWKRGTMETLTAPQYLPTYQYIEAVSYLLLLTSLLHATKTNQTKLLTLSILSSLSFHFYYFVIPSLSGIITWSATPSFLRLPLHAGQPHEILFTTFAIYAGCLSSNSICYRFKLLHLSEFRGCIASLGALLLIVPYEILATHFLWKTWHTNQPILCGIPISTLVQYVLFTTMVIGKSYSESLNIVKYRVLKSTHQIIISMLLLAILVQWLLQLVTFDFYKLSTRTLMATLLLIIGKAVAQSNTSRHSNKAVVDKYNFLDTKGFRFSKGIQKSIHEKSMFANASYAGVVLFYFVSLIYIGLFCDPSTHVSFGFHQKWGGSLDTMEMQKHANWKLCDESFEGFAVGAIDYNHNTVGWYGICGIPVEGMKSSLTCSSICSIVGIFWFGIALCIFQAPLFLHVPKKKVK